MPLRRSRILVVVLLALVAFSPVFLQAPGLAKAQSSSIPLSQEYASGDIQVPYYAGGTLLLWYSWININGTPHYGWGVTYGSIQAILINATQPGYGYGGGMPASYAMIDHVSMFYDYSVSGNTTFLKTSYQIGNVTLIPPRSPGVTLQGL